MGVVSPIGIGREPFWTSLCEGRSGVRSLEMYADGDLPATIGARVVDLHPGRHVRPRKALKVMSWDIQLGVVASTRRWIPSPWTRNGWAFCLVPT